jgi:hypothetical protein
MVALWGEKQVANWVVHLVELLVEMTVDLKAVW